MGSNFSQRYLFEINVIVLLEFDLAYFDVAVLHVNQYTSETPSHRLNPNKQYQPAQSGPETNDNRGVFLPPIVPERELPNQVHFSVTVSRCFIPLQRIRALEGFDLGFSFSLWASSIILGVWWRVKRNLILIKTRRLRM